MKKIFCLLTCILIWFFFTGIAMASQPFPDTGQTKCYNNSVEITCPQAGQPFHGQDPQYPRIPRSYTKLGQGGVVLANSALHVDDGGPWIMIRDNVTGLIWEVKTNANRNDKYTRSNAQNVFIEQLNAQNFGGFSDWRLPEIKELSSLVNKEVYNPAIDNAWFPKTVSSSYWSSTSYGLSYSWLVRFYHGNVGNHYKSTSRCVRAVRSGHSGTFDNFIDNGDGTATDTVTGLMWQKETAPGTYTWQQALEYAENLTFPANGYSDWRLPNINELQTLVDYSNISPAIFPVFRPHTVSSQYWSSTTDAYNTSYSWRVNFHYGYVYDYYKSRSYCVRAVRSGQSDIGQFGNLRVSIEPQGAREDGSQWRRTETTIWRNSGYTESNIPVGSHTVEFKEVSGWTKPANKSVNIQSGQTANVTGTYGSGASISVTSPSAGAQWQRGTTQTIRWTSTGSVGNVQIQLRDTSGNYSTIVSSVSNSGSYNWAIPSNGEIGSGFQVRVSDVNQWSTVYSLSGSFTLASSFGEILDQFQPSVNYGFWFEDDVIRWQEFIPELNNVTSVEVFIEKRGNPGNIIIEIRTTNGITLSQKTISEAESPSYGWVRAEFSTPVFVSPGTKYRIYVYSDTGSPSELDRYFWLGTTESIFCSECDNDVIGSWPNYAYAFKTFGIAYSLIFNDDFESYSVGTFPTSGGWELIYNGYGTNYQYITNTSSVSGSKSLKLEGQANWSANTIKILSQTPDIVNLSVWVKTKKLASSVMYYDVARVSFHNKDYGSWGTCYAGLEFSHDNKIRLIGTDSPLVVGQWESEQWYKIQIKYDSLNNKATVWIDDVLKVSNSNLTSKQGFYNSILLKSGNDTHTLSWFDDVKVYIDSITPPCGMPGSISVPTSSTTGSYKVSWGSSSTGGVNYVLEEATNSAFTSNRRTANSGSGTSANITGRITGNTYYYRIKATKSGYNDSAWRTGSNGCEVIKSDLMGKNLPGILFLLLGEESNKQHLQGYFSTEWQNFANAEDENLSTYAIAQIPNIDLYVNYPYNNESGEFYWKATYGSSGSQHTVFGCKNHNMNTWESIWQEQDYVLSKTAEHKIPDSCIKPGKQIQLKIQSASWSRYYEGYIIRK